MNYRKAVDYLLEQLPMYQRLGKAAFKKDLTNIRLLCERLDNPQAKFPSIHVAGTNGKGSSSHMLAAIFQQSGYKTGLYTSPHLKSFTERIRLNGQEIPKEDVATFVSNHQSLIESIKPSFFEITVAMAFNYFALQNVDIAIIEVGLGGRLDSTNIIIPELSLITNIGYDHMDMLGETLSEIAGEKAGIIKEKTPIVISKYQNEVVNVFVEKANDSNAPISFASDSFSIAAERPYKVYRNKEILYSKVNPSLKGYHQIENLQGVLQCIDILKNQGWTLSWDNVKIGVENTVNLTGLKGRWQQLNDSPLTFCDVGHNEDGIREITQLINQYTYKQLWVIWGTVIGKEVEKMLALLPPAKEIIFCKADIPRAMDANELAGRATKIGITNRVIIDVNQALHEVRTVASPDDFIFIGGSTFIVAELENL